MPILPFIIFGGGVLVGGSVTWATFKTSEKLLVGALILGGAYIYIKSKR